MSAPRSKRLACRMGLHRSCRVVAVRHLLHGGAWGLSRPGSLVTYRCRRCGARWQRVSYTHMRRLDDVLRRR